MRCLVRVGFHPGHLGRTQHCRLLVQQRRPDYPVPDVRAVMRRKWLRVRGCLQGESQQEPQHMPVWQIVLVQHRLLRPEYGE